VLCFSFTDSCGRELREKEKKKKREREKKKKKKPEAYPILLPAGPSQ
jgi:hypothetical protein